MGALQKVLYRYDPRTNLLTDTTYKLLEEQTGVRIATLASIKSRGLKFQHGYLTDDTVTVQQRKAWYEKEEYHNETWKIIDGSENKFLISNYGRFKRVYKKHNGFLLPFLKKRNGSLEIKVHFKGRYGNHKIANLVAHHFVSGKKPGLVLHHKNGIITDDYSGNLEYISIVELGKKTGHKSRAREVVQLDRFTGEVLGEYRSAREAGRNTYLSYQSVIDCCNHKSKSSGGIYVFMWSDEYEKLHPEVEEWI